MTVLDYTAASAALSERQWARVAALHAARDVLAKSGASNVLGRGAVDPPDAIDLIGVAQFILDGVDPWERKEHEA